MDMKKIKTLRSLELMPCDLFLYDWDNQEIY